jgi:hypothetical protein
MKLQTTLFLTIITSIMILLGCNNPEKNSRLTKTNKIHKVPKNENEELFDSLDEHELLRRIFDDPDFDSNGIALWKPNYYERMNFNVSYDGKCHTVIDTIMYFTDREQRKCAAVILATYHYGTDCTDSTKVVMGDCHFCGAPIGIVLLYETPGKKWKLYEFKKAFTTMGLFGGTGREELGKISLLQVGDEWTVLSLTNPVGGNSGYLYGDETLYSIEQYRLNGFPNTVLSEIFTYNYCDVNENENDSTKHETRAVMKIIKKQKAYYDMDLIITTDKKVKTIHYKYSDDYNCYVER